jgi:hypothetical protein
MVFSRFYFVSRSWEYLEINAKVLVLILSKNALQGRKILGNFTNDTR